MDLADNHLQMAIFIKVSIKMINLMEKGNISGQMGQHMTDSSLKDFDKESAL
jgi:hypothetical protein